jgi:hypothetical protein
MFLVFWVCLHGLGTQIFLFCMELNPELFQVSNTEERHGHENLTYGSLTTKGMLTMVHTIRQIVPNTSSIEGMDLGCGDGELLFHLQEHLEGSNWYGVELCGSRVEKQRRPVFIWEGDMLEEPLHSYTILHADNLCLEEAIADRLEHKIACEFTGLYITYRTPENLLFLQKAIYLTTIPTETTWYLHPIKYYYIP